jgi:hypothetical protein
MKPWEKWTTWAGVLLTAGAALWADYTAHEAMKLKQPLDEHTEMVKSYQGQIDSAKSRKDLPTVTRLRVEYENYEERWRDLQRVTAIVAPLSELRVARLSAGATTTLNALVGRLSSAPTVANSAPTTMGVAYLALENYDSAAREFSDVYADPKALALKAAAFGGLANNTNDTGLKLQYETTARRSLEKSIKASYGTQDGIDVIRFARDTPSLVEFLPEALGQKQDAMAQEKK